ncbi:MAG: thiolase family protein [Acidimicrobiia bacterium]|nr:thiolase family protein [Acidimicrobiia bacterium]MDH5288365.1 thiolase family protein [Acidimicrobiia bacterium]
MAMRGRGAVVGVGELRPTRETPGETTLSLMAKAGLAAIEDAGLSFADIDGMVCHPIGGVSMLTPSTVSELMGLKLNFAEVVDLGGATGAGMIWRAVAAIEAGMCRAVVCITGSSRRPRTPRVGGSKTAGGWAMPDRSAFSEFEVPYGNVGANVGYAMIANRYLHEYGASPEQLAKVAVHQRDNANQNPDAIFYGQPITVDDVLSSPLIADPLHMLEIVMPAGGAAALVVVGPELAEQLPNRPAWLLGAGEQVTHKTITYAPSLTDTAIQASARRAFDQAGVNPSQIGLASVYDCYTITVLLTLEDSGFTPKGTGGRFIEEHDLRWNGDFPVNTHGGQLSFGQPGIAGGMSHVTEAVRQIQGRAGARQIPDLELAFVNGNGGILSEQVSLIFGRER